MKSMPTLIAVSVVITACALSVKRYLESLGFSKLQVDVTSYGKDRPLCLQHNPVCWQKNRSVHFIVKD